MEEAKQDQPKGKKRGGDVKKPPPGYYTAKQARERLGMTPSTFSYHVRAGTIPRYIPPLRKEGFYKKQEIDEKAREIELYLLMGNPPTEVRVARPADAEGIVQVLAVRGWPTATASQRRAWYEVNPLIDFIALWQGEVMGYIHAGPYTPDALSDMMSGRKRAWHIRPEDIRAYEPSGTYDLYIGIATRQDVPNHTQRFGFRLIAGFLSFLEDLASRHIYVRRLYAVSAEAEGQQLCHKLGFVEQPAEEGDLFPRFLLDLEQSDARFAQLYRKSIVDG